jgi:hypothetical protein
MSISDPTRRPTGRTVEGAIEYRLGMVKSTKVVMSDIFGRDVPIVERLIIALGFWVYIPVLAVMGTEWEKDNDD